MAQQSTSTHDVLKHPSLTRDKAEGQLVLEPLDLAALNPVHPVIHAANAAYQGANPANVLLVIPTSNKFKVCLLRDHLAATKPPGVNLDHLEVKADSQVGEQPLDSAGPQGAVNRVANAASKLFKDDSKMRDLRERAIGTVIVGAVENFIYRHASWTDKDGQTVHGPADYGVLVFCRISLVPGRADVERIRWSQLGVSRGVTVPADFMNFARTLGFDDEEELHGKVTVGEVIAANTGIDKANWHLPLAGASRYELLKEAMEKMKVPWPET
ncbi:hypothetical protein VTJ04DRAFT_1377 [Mycothermus thermophilus]|uniref:uncharacterized protein n=1 Tax=Humicola insolens TaxID=85995 RepID=UPI003743604E